MIYGKILNRVLYIQDTKEETMNMHKMGKSFLFLLLVLILTAAMCLSGTGYAQEAENPEAAESVSAEPAAGETAEEAEAIEPEPAADSEP